MNLLAFGPFVADPLLGTLRKNSVIVPLTPKAFEVLCTLLERRGELVEKDDLLKLVWPNTVVEENNLARHISTLRKVLSDQSTEHQYIVTIPGRGYRFVASVTAVPRAEGTRATPTAGPVAVFPAVSIEQPRALRLQSFVAGALFVLAAAAVVGMAVIIRRPAVDAAQQSRKLLQLTFDPGLQNEPSWSPDGRKIAYASDRDGNFDIWTQPAGDGDPVRVTSAPEHDWQPAWSPDGQAIAFRSERDGGGIFLVSPAGGPPRRLTDFGFRPRWSNDGQSLLFSGTFQPTVRQEPAIYVVGIDGGRPRPVFADLVGKLRAFRTNWHPDSHRISIYGGDRGGDWSFFTASLEAGSIVRSELAPAVVRKIRDSGVKLTNFVWAPAGDALYFEGSADGVQNLWRVGVDPRTLEWRSGPERLTVGTGVDSNIAMSPDGRRIAFSSRNERTRLWSFPFDAIAGRITGVGEAIAADVTDAAYDVSPDGRELVYRTSRAGKQELWRHSFEDGRHRMLAAGTSITVPRWSPDGTLLVFRRDNAGRQNGAGDRSDVVLLAADGGAERLLTSSQPVQSPAISFAPFDWSSDGRSILTSCRTQPAGPTGICAWSVADAPHAEQQRQVVVANPDLALYQARFSPDNRWICMNAVEKTGRSAIYAVPAHGGAWVRVTDGRGWDDKPRWSPDGRTIYFASNRAGFINIWGRRFDPTAGAVSGEPFRVTNFETPRQMIFPYMQPLQVVFTDNRLLLPVTESFGAIWVLDNVNP